MKTNLGARLCRRCKHWKKKSRRLGECLHPSEGRDVWHYNNRNNDNCVMKKAYPITAHKMGCIDWEELKT